MDKRFYSLVLSSILALFCCNISKAAIFPNKNQEKAPQGFTAADASLAYKAFNDFFYSSSAKLYYSNTKKDKLAAIWTQAVYWDLAMDVYERKHKKSQLKMINDIYQGGYNQYDGYNWNNTSKWFIYDDMMWWVMALSRANEITGNRIYLEKAIEGFNHVWGGSYDGADGGMFWDFKHSGKNACINYPTVIAAMRLYKITCDETYLTKAKSVYAWSKANLFNTTNGRVADHKIKMNRPGYEDYTYNQGTAIGAAVMLYKVTHDTAYLADARLAADYTMIKMSRDGILPAEGDYNEQGVLKAIFAQYIMQFIKVTPKGPYLKWIQKNVNTGWQNRDTSRNLTFRNYSVSCPTGNIQSYEASSIVTFMQLCQPFK